MRALYLSELALDSDWGGGGENGERKNLSPLALRVKLSPGLTSLILTKRKCFAGTMFTIPT